MELGSGVPPVWWTLSELRRRVSECRERDVLTRLSFANIAFARAGRGVEDLAREFEPCSHTTRSWLRTAGVAEGRHAPAVDELAVEERDELRRLRKEVRQLRQERDILSKARLGLQRTT